MTKTPRVHLLLRIMSMIDEDDCETYGVCPHTVGVVYDTQLYYGGAIGDLESDGEFDTNIDIGDESAPSDKEESELDSDEAKTEKKSAEDDDGPFIVTRAKETDQSPQTNKKRKKRGKKEENSEIAHGGSQMIAFTSIMRDFDNFLKHARLPL